MAHISSKIFAMMLLQTKFLLVVRQLSSEKQAMKIRKNNRICLSNSNGILLFYISNKVEDIYMTTYQVLLQFILLFIF